MDLLSDPGYLVRFRRVARRISSTHMLKPAVQIRKREYLYVAAGYIVGQTLSKWMLDSSRPLPNIDPTSVVISIVGCRFMDRLFLG